MSVIQHDLPFDRFFRNHCNWCTTSARNPPLDLQSASRYLTSRHMESIDHHVTDAFIRIPIVYGRRRQLYEPSVHDNVDNLHDSASRV